MNAVSQLSLWLYIPGVVLQVCVQGDIMCTYDDCGNVGLFVFCSLDGAEVLFFDTFQLKAYAVSSKKVVTLDGC